MDRTVSFEQACAIQSKIMTAENFRTLGVPETVARSREALAAVGWTSAELADESGRSMRDRIERMRQEEEKARTP